MSQRILILNPWGVDYMDEPARDVVSPRVRPDTSIEVRNLGDAAPALPWPVVGKETAMTSAARQAQSEGFDGLVIGCCADPYLAVVRDAVDIPVSAPTEAAVYMSRTMGKVAILARRLADSYLPLIPTQGNWDFWNGKAHEYGLRDGEYALRGVQVPEHPDPETLEQLTTADPEQLRDLTIAAMTQALRTDGVTQARAAVEEDGAQVLYFACAYWSRGIDELASDGSLFGVPVLNPLVTATTFVENAIISQGRMSAALTSTS
jgi:Asp/Glu/hydantoin racemase